MLSEDVRLAIATHPDISPGVIAKDIEERYGITVSLPAVLRIRAEAKREDNVRTAQSKASERLEEKMDITEELIQFYRDIIRDDTIPMGARLKAMNDLRGWIKLAVDAAGDTRTAAENIFEIAGDWDLGFEPRETN